MNRGLEPDWVLTGLELIRIVQPMFRLTFA